MVYSSPQFGFLPGLLFELHSSMGSILEPQASMSPRRALRPLFFYVNPTTEEKDANRPGQNQTKSLSTKTRL